ncbi:MAG TPA: rhomboid family intramembrane serine protease [Tepidisphaeraceae bacterium]|nr:rhomboid family intramembrane serine protease [Tepidisphaeraceae bacterium]
MGIYDRDYTRRAREPSNLWESMRTWSASTWIAVVLIAAFLANGFTRSPDNQMTGWLYNGCNFAVPQAIDHAQLWRFATFQFVHDGLWLMIFNFAAVIACGPMVEAYMGSRRFMIFYLICGLAPVIPFIVGWYTGAIHPFTFPRGEFDGMPASFVAFFQPHLSGASGATMGILLFAAIRAGEGSRIDLPGLTTISLDPRLLAWILFAIVVWFTLPAGGVSPQNVCHLAGAAVSAGVICGPALPIPFPRRRRRVYSRGRR